MKSESGVQRNQSKLIQLTSLFRFKKTERDLRFLNHTLNKHYANYSVARRCVFNKWAFPWLWCHFSPCNSGINTESRKTSIYNKPKGVSLNLISCSNLSLYIFLFLQGFMADSSCHFALKWVTGLKVFSIELAKTHVLN